MEANLPTTPGPYWWRERDGDEWRSIILTHVDIEAIQEDIPEFGEAYIDGMTVSGGQWAKAHNPDEITKLKACQDELKNIVNASPTKWEMTQDEFADEFWGWAQSRARHVLYKVGVSSVGTPIPNTDDGVELPYKISDGLYLRKFRVCEEVER